MVEIINVVSSRKIFFFFFEKRVIAHAQLCGNISRYKCKCLQFNNLAWCFLGLGNRKLCNTFTRKRDCLKVYFLITLLKNVSYNIFQNSLEERITNFDISAALKRRKIKIVVCIIVPCKNQAPFNLWRIKNLVKYQKFSK